MTQSAPIAQDVMPVVSMDMITKTFPGVKALDHVKLDLNPGQGTALVGENGAGKSTTVKILTGIYRTDGGTIRIDGNPDTFASPNDAASAGITAIHQETVLFDELSLAENIYIGHAPRNRFGLIDTAQMHRDAAELLTEIGAPFSSHTQLSDLGIANKHLVAIARALSVDARVVIMDEPTAALSHKEIEELYELVDTLKAQGKAILFISHKFDEIFRIADRYTVFRDGGFVGDGVIADISENDLVKMMVGRSVEQIFPDRKHDVGEEVLKVVGYDHPTEFSDIGFSLKRGEILGFYGLVGAGRSEFMQALFDITKPSKGVCQMDGVIQVIRSPAQAVEYGVVYVPEDRGKQGAVIGLPIFQNITLPSLSRTSRRGFLRLAEELKLARTQFGRSIFAVGGTPHAAVYTGIDVGKTQFWAFVASGALAGLTGYLWVARYAVAYVDIAGGFELEVVAACVIGGISIAGGMGFVRGAVLGAIFLGVVKNALPVVDISPIWQLSISGSAILIAVAFNARSGRIKGRVILKSAEATK